MKKDNWLDIINEIDDKYLKMSEGEPRVMDNIFKRNIQKVLAVASILVLVGISAFAISIKMGKPGEDIAGVNTETESENAVGMLESRNNESETTKADVSTEITTEVEDATTTVNPEEETYENEDIETEVPNGLLLDREDMDVVYELSSVIGDCGGKYNFWIGQKGNHEFEYVEREGRSRTFIDGDTTTYEGWNKENKRRIAFMYVSETKNEGDEEPTVITGMMIYDVAWDDTEIYVNFERALFGSEGPGANDNSVLSPPEGFTVEGEINEYIQETILNMEYYKKFMDKARECTSMAIIEKDGTVVEIPSEEIKEKKIYELMFPMFEQ